MKIKRWSSPTKKGQVSTIDFITGLLIMITSIVIAANLLVSLSDNTTFDELTDESKRITDMLMSSGYPEYWNNTNVVKPGLLSQNRLNVTKLNQLDNRTYNQLRGILGTRNDLYWYYTNATGVINLTACGYGDPTVVTDNNCTPTITATGNLIRTERFVAYQSKIVSMVILTWD